MSTPTRVDIARRGLLFVISSPSGAGKSTLARRLLEENDALQLSISVTTRPKRPNEVDGVDYVFVSKGEFDAMAASGALLEHAVVFDNCYGTPREPVETALKEGRDVLFDVDWQGARQLEKSMPSDLVRVFLLPPTAKALEERLLARAQDPVEVVRKRMARGSDEISHWPEYEYVVVNDDLEAAYAKLRAILMAERAKRVRQTGLDDFIRRLQDEF